VELDRLTVVAHGGRLQGLAAAKLVEPVIRKSPSTSACHLAA
jgi:hypothetical protein